MVAKAVNSSKWDVGRQNFLWLTGRGMKNTLEAAGFCQVPGMQDSFKIDGEMCDEKQKISH